METAMAIAIDASFTLETVVHRDKKTLSNQMENETDTRIQTSHEQLTNKSISTRNVACGML
jgi:hypothetical protein